MFLMTRQKQTFPLYKDMGRKNDTRILAWDKSSYRSQNTQKDCDCIQMIREP